MLDISWDKFDTVCYNLQHNVIELIRHTVGISVEVNFVSGRIDQTEQKVSDLFDIQGSMYDTMVNMNETLKMLNDALATTNGQITILDQYIYDLEQRVEALENK